MTGSRPQDLFQPGDLINNTYRIEGVLGRGGTSDVYHARSEISGRAVAIKVLKAEFAGNVDFMALMTREEEMREIRHDAVVRYSECHRTPEGHVYLLMDYVEGPGMDEMLRKGPMPVDDLMVICRRVASGLEAAHDRNIVHRDLSPDNVILRNGDPASAVIIDFGIAKDTNPGAQTIVGNDFAGKYSYAAPEQLAGNTDRRTDIYSLGALLLACFRGEKPDMGRNPMETIQKKAQPLDLIGVPEPLLGLLAKMTDPDPAMRFQTARQVIEAIDGGPVPAPAHDPDATVITPRSTARVDLAGLGATPIAPAAAPPRRNRTRLVVGGIVAVAVMTLAGLWMAGFMNRLTGPSYPSVQPFALTVDATPGQPITASGHVPDTDMQLALGNLARQDGGSANLTLASGAIADSWPADVMGLIDIASRLDSWQVRLADDTATVTGQTTDGALRDAVMTQLSPFPGALTGTADIAVIVPDLPAQTLDALLVGLADCGPLALTDVPASGSYAQGATVTVTGTVATDETLAMLNGALQAAAGSRPIQTDTVGVLNPALCLIENYLPQAPTSGVRIDFANGGADITPNQQGNFVVGDNPVIDVIVPDDMTDGYLSVSILDVTGDVFHLLPNLTRPQADIAQLREGQTGPLDLRVAYDVATAQAEGRIGFQVDDSALGKSKVVVIHSTGPLFDTMRPTSESASSYAEALRDGQAASDARILSLDSRILTTALP